MMFKAELLKIKIDFVSKQEALDQVQSWLSKKGKHYIVTPNPEMLVDATSDKEFRLTLNKSSLAIPDSSRLGWATYFTRTNNLFLRLLYFPFFLLPQFLTNKNYPTTTGADLMESLIELSEEKAYTTAYLGGTSRVAEKLFECLKQKYPKLKIVFCSGNAHVDLKGKTTFDTENIKMTTSKQIKPNHSSKTQLNPHILSEKIDIMFVAFGHRKQEKWMYQNLDKLNTRVMVGVGGSFDYLSGSVPRAPHFMQALGFEWLFRFMLQPWRIKRFWKLPYFLYMVMTSKS